MDIKGGFNWQDGVRVGPFKLPVAESKNMFTGEHVGTDSIAISLCESMNGTRSDAKTCLDSRITCLYLCPVRQTWRAETAELSLHLKAQGAPLTSCVSTEYVWDRKMVARATAWLVFE